MIEDAHWADEATLDLLVFVGRRVAATPGMVVVVTYRDDEVGPGHPLRRVIGDLATALGAPPRAPGADQGRRGHPGPPAGDRP